MFPDMVKFLRVVTIEPWIFISVSEFSHLIRTVAELHKTCTYIQHGPFHKLPPINMGDTKIKFQRIDHEYDKYWIMVKIESTEVDDSTESNYLRLIIQRTMTDMSFRIGSDYYSLDTVGRPDVSIAKILLECDIPDESYDNLLSIFLNLLEASNSGNISSVNTARLHELCFDLIFHDTLEITKYDWEDEESE